MCGVNSDQKDVFLGSEADAWFRRNSELPVFKQPIDLTHIFETLKHAKTSVNRIIEIGCSDGNKTLSIANFFNSIGCGVDPSKLAIAKANSAKPNGFEFKVGTSDSLPFSENEFDLVYFGFCLYLVDRNLIFKSLSEADRVLKPGGYLVITDFDASRPYKSEYKHKQGIMSYRNDYAAMFLASGHYSLISKLGFAYDKKHFELTLSERISTSILYKEIDAYPNLHLI